MNIDYAATKHNCRLLNMANVAREIGVTPPLVYSFLNQKLRYASGPKVQRIVEFLRQNNLLVEAAEQ
jgi:predicted DNA-binding transcriptional regulator AlpA